jgi:hypothetical protein
VADELIEEMRRHWAEPFPDSVEKGLDYGDADAVMIGADINGWAQIVASGSALSHVDRERLRQAAEEWRGATAAAHGRRRATQSVQRALVRSADASARLRLS